MLEAIYVKQPERFIVDSEKKMVQILKKKTWYALKQATM